MSSTPSFRPLSSLSCLTSGTTHPYAMYSRSETTRPGTSARPQTAASTRHEGSFVIALLESRGVAHEVGIAAMDKDTGRIMLVQVRAHPPSASLSDPSCNISWQIVQRMSRRCTRCTSITLRSSLFLIRLSLLRTRRWRLQEGRHQRRPYWSSILWKSFPISLWNQSRESIGMTGQVCPSTPKYCLGVTRNRDGLRHSIMCRE